MISRRLIISTEGLQTFSYEIVDQSVEVGRDKANDIVIPDSKVSRKHCRFDLMDGVVMLNDCGAKNGLFVNGTRQDNIRIINGDRIKIGNSILEISIEEEAGIEVLEEQTIEFDTLGMVIFQDEHTQENVVFTTSEPESETLPPARIHGVYYHDETLTQSKISTFFKKNKIYLLSGCLLMLGFCLFLFGRAGNSQKNISPDNQGSSSETHLQQQNAQQAESRGSSQENRALATRMAKEADTLSNLGKRVQAIAMYQEALKIDPENELAKTNLSLLNERVVKLAESCFNNGLQAYNFFEYETAINQWENTLFLLEKNKKHKLYIKTSRFLEEAREKAIK